MLFYSRTTGGFYDSEIHGTMPGDAVEITQEDHAALMTGQSSGLVITADDSGHPVLVYPPQPPELTQAELNAIRIEEIKTDLAALDIKRIRPMAEGGTEYLATLNDQAVMLRYELQGLIAN